MKKEAWFQFPESIATQRQGEALHQLMQENFAHLAIVAILSGLAVTGTLVLTGAAPAWLAILPLTAVAILSLALRRSRSLWPAWPQRLLLVILTWILTGATLLPAWTSGQQTTRWAVFLLAILACAALTTRPLADHLASLCVPALVAGVRILVPAVSHESLGLALALALTLLLALVIAALQFDQAMRLLHLARIAAAQQRQLDELSLRDPVTSLYHEPAFRTRLSIELARANRYKHPLCLLLIEIRVDGQLLQSRDQKASEKILASLAEALNKTLRTTDILGYAQLGRFLVALPDTTLANARIAATRIQATITRYNADSKTTLTMNCGISQHHGEALEALLLVTEARLQEAIRLGPDQMVVE